MSKSCPGCGLELDIEIACPRCGWSFEDDDPDETFILDARYECPACGAGIDSMISDCPNCGFEFGLST